MKKRCNGMTLVEVLIAFVLSALIFTLGFEALYVGSRNLQTTAQAADNNGEWRQGVRMLGRFLRQTQAIKRLRQDDVHRMLFTGNPDRLAWVAPLAGHSSGIYELELWRQGDELLLSYVPLRSADDNDTPERTTTQLRLMSLVQNLELSYYGADSIDSPSRWHNEWLAMAQLPKLVRLSVNRKGQRRELVFALTISSFSNNPYQVLRHDAI